MKSNKVLLVSILTVFSIVAAYYAFRYLLSMPVGTQRLLAWLRSPNAYADRVIQAKTRCGDAPFILPTDGYVGYLWGDIFRVKGPHQGIDVFGGADPGQVPVYSVYDAFLTRESNWKSAVILRIPQDPLSPDRQIWVYFTHMADEAGNSFIADDFPPGTFDQYIPAGTFIGYQGNFSGDSRNPTGVHLHLSIVLSNPDGSFKNELDIDNTIDPSAYFGLPLSNDRMKDELFSCMHP